MSSATGSPEQSSFTVNCDEAKHCLLMHGSGTLDSVGQPLVLEDGFLGSLRPYRGLLEKNFHIVMEALFVVGEEISCSPQIDCDLVESLWSMCTSARCWGVRPDGILQRDKLITAAETIRLAQWVGTVESTAQGLLRGCPPHYWVHKYAQYINDVGWWDNIGFFIPLMERALLDEDLSDPSIVVEALGKMGGMARSALPALYEAASRVYSWYLPEDRCTEEVRRSIRQAIRSIENAE
jgi:hypothetical protein